MTLGRSCSLEHKSAAISTEFGMKMLVSKFANHAELLEKLGTFSRGPRKGLPRGYVCWTKVAEGGWDYSAHRLRRGGTFDWCVRVDRHDDSEILASLVNNSN